MSFGSRKETAKNIIEDKRYRDFYTETYLKKSVPFQLRTMRTERGWSQEFAGEILGKGQNAVSRLESLAYGKLTLQTLLKIAKGYDVGLVVKFVPYSKLLKEYEDVSFHALSAPSPTAKFENELESIWKWADEKDDDGFWEAETAEQTSVSAEIKNVAPQCNRMVYYAETKSLGYIKAGEVLPEKMWGFDNTAGNTLKIGNTVNLKELV